MDNIYIWGLGNVNHNCWDFLGMATLLAGMPIVPQPSAAGQSACWSRTKLVKARHFISPCRTPNLHWPNSTCFLGTTSPCCLKL